MTLLRGESAWTAGRCPPPSGGGTVPVTTCATLADFITRWTASTDLSSNPKDAWWVKLDNTRFHLHHVIILTAILASLWKKIDFITCLHFADDQHVLSASVCLEEGWPVLHQLSHHHHHSVATKRRGRACLQRLWALHETPWGKRKQKLHFFIENHANFKNTFRFRPVLGEIFIILL